MSLMANFDLVAEISKETLLNLVKKHMTIAGVAANPPFEVSVPLSGDGLTGDVHLIVTALALTLNPNDSVSLTLTFERSSILLSAPTKLSLSGLAGKIIIQQAPITLALKHPSDLWTQRLAIDLRAASVSVTVSTLPDSSHVEVARHAIERFAQKLGLQMFPPDLVLVPRSLLDGKPAGNGSLDPLRFVRLELHRINPETLGLFGVLLAENDKKGIHTLKTTTAISAGHNLCVSLSPEAFHALVFCPAVAKGLNTPGPGLPGSCGSAEGVSMGGAIITNISDSFAEGHINLDLLLRKSGSCELIGSYEATGSLHSEVSFLIEDAKLKPSVKPSEPKISVELDFWCSIAVAVFAGPIGFVLIEMAKSIATSVASGLVKSELDKGAPGISLGNFFGATFDKVAITPEGLTLNGNLALDISPPNERGLVLDGLVNTLSTELVKTGVYTKLHGCPHGNFPYREYLQWQEATYIATPILLARPLQLEWFIGDSPIPLTGTSGTTTLTLQRQYPSLPSGTPVVGLVTLNYEVSGTQIRFTNLPADGNFNFLLRVRATEPDGSILEDIARLTFEGHTITIEGYLAAYIECMLKHAPPARRSPISDFEFDRGVRNIRDIVRAFVTSEDPEADNILAATKLAFGSAFYRALTMPEVTVIDLSQPR